MQTPVSLSHSQTKPEALRLGVKPIDAGPNQKALPCMYSAELAMWYKMYRPAFLP